MLLVMDESGDPGLNIPTGQNPWLVVGGALFPTRDAAEACSAALLELRGKLGGIEFHFTHSTFRRRHQVLDCLAGQTFRYYAVACNKLRLDRHRWRKPADLQAELARRVTTLVAHELVGCSLWFDTLGGRDRDRAYGKLIQQAAGCHGDKTPRIRNWKALDSRREVLIQAADYVCGVVSRSLRIGEHETDELKRIAHQRGRIEMWPEPEGE